MIFDGYVHQWPDTDPAETQEWLDSLDAIVDTHGKTRARFLLSKLLERAREAQVSVPANASTPLATTRARFLRRKLRERPRESQVSFPATVSPPYVNTIPREAEPWFPGD